MYTKERYPWVTQPLIANAPMGGFAGGDLAATVSLAGGVGFIGAVNDMKSLEAHLESAVTTLENSPIKSSTGILPIGVGFLLFAVEMEEAVAVIAKYSPAIIWLACPKKTEDFKSWTGAIRSASPSSSIWIQTASVAAGLELAENCSPQALVMQGYDAGGHGPRPGASIISLVPEMKDSLDRNNIGNIEVYAAGGISDGRGIAAALACGANGAVLGTRFLASKEVQLPAEEYRDVILRTNDGGVATARGTIFDELKGKSIWPGAYDGRAVVNSSYRDYLNNVTIEDIRDRHNSASKEKHKGFGGDMRAAVWAGTGIGLVKEIQGAAEIVTELREGAIKSLTMTLKSYAH